jgi:excisionase family DNA binding protein
VVEALSQPSPGPNPFGAIAIELPPSLLEALSDRVAEVIAARLDDRVVAKRWLNTDEAANYLSIPKKRLYTHRERLGIPCHKQGSLLLFDRLELDQWASRLGPDG